MENYFVSKSNIHQYIYSKTKPEKFKLLYNVNKNDKICTRELSVDLTGELEKVNTVNNNIYKEICYFLEDDVPYIYCEDDEIHVPQFFFQLYPIPCFNKSLNNMLDKVIKLKYESKNLGEILGEEITLEDESEFLLRLFVHFIKSNFEYVHDYKKYGDTYINIFITGFGDCEDFSACLVNIIEYLRTNPKYKSIYDTINEDYVIFSSTIHVRPKDGMKTTNHSINIAIPRSTKPVLFLDPCLKKPYDSKKYSEKYEIVKSDMMINALNEQIFFIKDSSFESIKNMYYDKVLKCLDSHVNIKNFEFKLNEKTINKLKLFC